MAGHSGSPLARKLGIKEGHRVASAGAPPGFPELLPRLPRGALLEHDPRDGEGLFDVVILFARRARVLEAGVGRWKARIPKEGALWVAWPKKSSSLETDLDKATVQRAGLDVGLVDNKVCAVDPDWSALRFVYRLTDR